jgi:hypothetical protein
MTAPMAGMMILVVTMLVCPAVSAQMRVGFTGNDWKSLPPIGRQSYVAGLSSGWMNVVAVAKSEGNALTGTLTQEVVQIVDCVQARHIPMSQIASIVEKYDQDHPERLDTDMDVLAWGAMTQACK